MKKLIIISLVFILASCGKDSNTRSAECGCEDIKGLYYHNFPQDDDNYIDDMEYDNGNIHLHRYGAGHDGTKMTNVFKYRFDANCVATYYDFDSTRLVTNPIETNFYISPIVRFDNGVKEVRVPYTQINCESHMIYIVEHLNYNPR